MDLTPEQMCMIDEIVAGMAHSNEQMYNERFKQVISSLDSELQEALLKKWEEL